MAYQLTRGQIRLAGIRARKGGVEEQTFLSNAFLEYRRIVNKEIRGLRRERFTYSRGYKFINQFIVNEFDETNLIPELSEFNGDWEAVARALNHMVKFRQFKDSTVERMRDIEARRIRTIRDKLDIPEGFTDRQMKNFLRFLSREETSQIIDLYGNSDDMIEYIFEVYTKKGNSRAKLSRAFAEFLEKYENDPYHMVDISETFEKLGLRRFI